MKNLKRALSLALSSVMLVGMMAVGGMMSVGAGAASFGDADKIDNIDAVNTMVALGVIKGDDKGNFDPERTVTRAEMAKMLGVIKGDDKGNFDPERTVTRAEMAKMVCVALNGGTDPNLAGGGLYPDTKNHWAAGYIDYCTNMGIVSGDNHGNFNPDKTVTGTEAAKMMLMAMGYNAQTEKFVNDANWAININVNFNPDKTVTGTEAAKMMLMAMGYNAQTEKFVNDANWAININVLASTRGLYKNVNSVPDAGLTRDNAAQLIFNGIQANMVKYELAGIVGGNGISQSVELNKTILSDRYNTYEEAPEAVMTAFDYNSTKKEWTYTVDGKTFTTDKDFTSLFGMNVRVIAQDPKLDSDKEVYGIFAVDSAVLAEGFSGDMGTVKNKEVKFDGETYKLDDKYATVAFRTGAAASVNADQPAAVKLIDNDGNSKVDTIIVTPFHVSKVTYIGKSSVTVAPLGNVDLADVKMDDKIAKDDIVIVTKADYTATEEDTIALAEMATATVTGKKTVDGEVNYLIDGEWYTLATGVDTLNVNDEIDFVAFGGVVYNAKITESVTGTGALAMVYKMGNKAASGVGDASVEAKLIFADGSKKTGIIAKINGVEITSGKSNNTPTNIADGKDYVGEKQTDSKTHNKYETADQILGELVTYKVNSDGEYEIKTLPANYNDKKVMGYNGTTDKATYVQNADKIGNKDLADDAVVFFYSSEGKAEVYTGKELKKSTIDSSLIETKGPAALYATSKGFSYAQVAAVKNDKLPTVTVGSNYGYLTADAYETEKGTDTYFHYEMWTEDGQLTVSEKNPDADLADLADLTAGTVVTYDSADADTVKNVAKVTATLSYVTGYDEAQGEKIQIEGTTATKIENDTVILFVDSDKQEGVEGGTLSIADKMEGNAYTNNVLYIDSGDQFVLIIADVNNQMKVGGKIAGGNTVSSVNTALGSANSVTSDITAISSDLEVAAGKTLTLTGTVTDVSGLKGEGNVVVTGSITDANYKTLGVTVKATKNGTLPAALKLSGTGDIKEFWGSKALNDIAKQTKSDAVSFKTITFTKTQAPKDATVKGERYFDGEWQAMEGVLADGSFQVKDNEGLTLNLLLGNNVEMVRITITNSDKADEYTFTNEN